MDTMSEPEELGPTASLDTPPPPNAATMAVFRRLLANTLATGVTSSFLWFALTFWVYLETRSVVATSLMAGVYTVTTAGSGFFLGSLVDRYPKKTVMLWSSVVSLALYSLAGAYSS